jgi:HAD superfamily hydrolase (TIGR01509 family)
VAVTREQFERDFAGKKNEEIFPSLLGRPLPPAELAELAEEKESTYRQLYRAHLAPMPGAVPLLERLAARGVRLALATAAPRANRELVLSGLGWGDRFEAIAGAEDAARGKPAPDIFLAAARRLGVPPESCLAFEDAVNGIRSAVSAGMLACGILSTTPAELLHQAGASWTARDFTSLPAELEQALLG